VIWNYLQTGTGWKFDPDGTAVIAANPTFNV
jgi:hypothetical protein